VRTYSPKASEITRKWYVVDAEGQTLGRLASELAKVLKGKHKAIYSPHLDTGDYVVVINAEKVHVTGRKMDQKVYYSHSGYPGGLKSVTLREQLKRHPTRVLRSAVKGMLPHHPLGRTMLRKLKIYAGDMHPHQAQQPKALEF